MVSGTAGYIYALCYMGWPANVRLDSLRLLHGNVCYSDRLQPCTPNNKKNRCINGCRKLFESRASQEAVFKMIFLFKECMT